MKHGFPALFRHNFRNGRMPGRVMVRCHFDATDTKPGISSKNL